MQKDHIYWHIEYSITKKTTEESPDRHCDAYMGVASGVMRRGYPARYGDLLIEGTRLQGLPRFARNDSVLYLYLIKKAP